MALEAYLVERLAKIPVERRELLARLDEIREKMARADERKAGQKDTPNYKKWSSIYRDLERELDKCKAALTALDAEEVQKTRRLEEKRAENDALRETYERIDAMPFDQRQSVSREEMKKYLKYKRVLRDRNQLAHTTPSPAEGAPKPADKASVSDPLPSPPVGNEESVNAGPIPAPSDAVMANRPVQPEPAAPQPAAEIPMPVSAEPDNERTPAQPTSAGEERSSPSPDAGAIPDLYGQTPAGAAPEPDRPEPAADGGEDQAPSVNDAAPASLQSDEARRKQELRIALEKSQRGEVAALTLAEVATLFGAYPKLVLKGASEPDAAELAKDVSVALWDVHARCARICAHWADLARRNAANLERSA